VEYGRLLYFHPVVLLFFPRLISAAADWMSAILAHMVWPQCEFKMQIWNVLHAARWKYRMQEVAKKSPSGHHRTTLSGYIFATKARIDNRKKLVKRRYLLQMSTQYGELRPTGGWDRSGSLGHPCKFQWVSHLGSVTARHSSSARQPVALNRRHHLYSAGWPSCWALAHISSFIIYWVPIYRLLWLQVLLIVSIV